MSGLESGRGGVYRVLAPAAEIEPELTAAGWRVVVIPEVARTSDFYAAVRTAMGLPGWTGANLDALWDVLTDLAEPTALVWNSYGTYAVARPERWRRILAVLEERSAQDPPFALVLA